MSTSDPDDALALIRVMISEMRSFRSETTAALQRIESTQLTHSVVLDRIDRLSRARDESLDERVSALEESSSQPRP